MLLPENKCQEQIHVHFDPPTIQRGMEYNEDSERYDEEYQRQRDAHNVQDAHCFVECHLRQAGVVVRPCQVGVFIPLPSSISLAILLRGFAISIEFWIVRMIPELQYLDCPSYMLLLLG